MKSRLMRLARIPAWAAAIALGAAIIATGTASAATVVPQLRVTLSAAQGGAASWDASGNPVLTVSAAALASGGYAQVTVPGAAGQVAPAMPPSFTTDNYGPGDPRWVLELANGNWLTGYPAQLGGTANDAFTGNQWSVNNGNTYETYAKALAGANDILGNVAVTSAYIVDDGYGNPNPDTLRIVQYGSAVLQTTASATGEIRNVGSGKCLDVTNGVYLSGRMQQWTCGAAGGANQNFRIATFADGRSYLEAIPLVKGAAPAFVTSSRQGAQLTLSASPLPGSVMARSGSFYTYPGTGLVTDVSGKSTANGAFVQGWAKTGATNQQWSLP